MDASKIAEHRATALNGRSTRPPNQFYAKEPGDNVCGTVVEIGTQFTRWGEAPYFILKVEEGASGGKALEPGDWAKITAVPAVLRNFVTRDAPQVGDFVALEYRGKETFRGGSRHDFVVGCVRSHELGLTAVAAGGDRPW